MFLGKTRWMGKKKETNFLEHFVYMQKVQMKRNVNFP